MVKRNTQILMQSFPGINAGHRHFSPSAQRYHMERHISENFFLLEERIRRVQFYHYQPRNFSSFCGGGEHQFYSTFMGGK